MCTPSLGMCAPSLGMFTCARPHLECARPHLCAPSLGMCVPSLGMWAHPQLACARPHLACVRPLCPPLSKKQCRCPTTPLSVRIVVFLPTASLWDSWVRPHLACARPRLCAPSPSAPLQKAMSVSNYPPYPCVLLCFCLRLPCGIVGCTLTWHVSALTCARPHLACARPHLARACPHLACACPLRPPLSEKQCRCPTTPLMRAYCCLFALRYLVG
jgi:hypothetical protein